VPRIKSSTNFSYFLVEEGRNRPSNIVMLRPHSQAQFALDLNPHNQRKQKLPPGKSTFPFRDSEESTSNRTGGMDDGVEMCIVVVMHVGCYPVDKCCMLGVDFDAFSTKERGLRGAEEGGERVVLNKPCQLGYLVSQVVRGSQQL
jgi:hypothetical protein